MRTHRGAFAAFCSPDRYLNPEEDFTASESPADEPARGFEPPKAPDLLRAASQAGSASGTGGMPFVPEASAVPSG
jgi:hypothetical protein